MKKLLLACCMTSSIFAMDNQQPIVPKPVAALGAVGTTITVGKALLPVAIVACSIPTWPLFVATGAGIVTYKALRSIKSGVNNA